MDHQRLELDVLAEPLAICRLAHDAPIPTWATHRPFFTVTRTADELSIICAVAQVAPGVIASSGWRALRVRGPLDVALVGALVAIAQPLAAAGVSIMPVATHDTDYVLVREVQLALAIEALVNAGHVVHRPALAD